MYPEFQNKVVLITGGNSGIGKSAALSFAREGAKVVLGARRSPEGEAVSEEIRGEGGEATFLRTDVTESDQVKALVETAVNRYGRLDYAFNNAGIEGRWLSPIEEQTLEDWNQTIHVNLTGVFLSLKYEIPLIREQGQGAIVNMASIAGQVGSGIGAAAYFSSKHGVVGLTRCAALENADRGIRINAVCPAVIETPMAGRLFGEMEEETREMHPIGRFGRAEEVAAVVLWLCSDSASYVLGQAISIDGGILAGFQRPPAEAESH